MYRVLFGGEVVAGHEIDEVKQRIATLCELELSCVEAMFSDGPGVLHRGLDRTGAEAACAALMKAGAVVWAQAEQDQSELKQGEGHHEPTTRTCPRCGHCQPSAETACLRCGIIWAKMHQSQSGPPFPLSGPEPSEASPSPPITLAGAAMLGASLVFVSFVSLFITVQRTEYVKTEPFHILQEQTKHVFYFIAPAAAVAALVVGMLLVLGTYGQSWTRALGAAVIPAAAVALLVGWAAAAIWFEAVNREVFEKKRSAGQQFRIAAAHEAANKRHRKREAQLAQQAELAARRARTVDGLNMIRRENIKLAVEFFKPNYTELAHNAVLGRQGTPLGRCTCAPKSHRIKDIAFVYSGANVWIYYACQVRIEAGAVPEFVTVTVAISLTRHGESWRPAGEDGSPSVVNVRQGALP